MAGTDDALASDGGGLGQPAWALRPEDLGALGYPRDPAHLFGRLHRLGTWGPEGPVLARPAREFVASVGLQLELPRVAERMPSTDGATRLVLAFADGARVEAVHMPRGARTTVCLSSQVGCAMGCGFCATAKMGLVRSLEAHEIVGELLAVLQDLGPRSAERLNLVFMGMGEPLHDAEKVIRALDGLGDPAGRGVAPSRVTVSTSGLVPGIARLAEARFRPELAVSVNEVTDAARTRLMPVNKRWPLAALREALARWPRRPHEKLTLEYVLLAGENDSLAHAERLAAWVGDLRSVVNVIPFNAWDGGGFREPSPEVVARFAARLHELGCLVKVRKNRARDARGACGTLATPGFRGAVPLDSGA